MFCFQITFFMDVGGEEKKECQPIGALITFQTCSVTAHRKWQEIALTLSG